MGLHESKYGATQPQSENQYFVIWSV